jgi:hypothetical protein
VTYYLVSFTQVVLGLASLVHCAGDVPFPFWANIVVSVSVSTFPITPSAVPACAKVVLVVDVSVLVPLASRIAAIDSTTQVESAELVEKEPVNIAVVIVDVSVLTPP